MKMETLKQQILTAKGDVRAELVLKNARVINVFTNEIEQADVAISQGVILGVGNYTGETELDLQGKYVCPGLVDGHIHIESSMLCGPAFEQAVENLYKGQNEEAFWTLMGALNYALEMETHVLVPLQTALTVHNMPAPWTEHPVPAEKAKGLQLWTLRNDKGRTWLPLFTSGAAACGDRSTAARPMADYTLQDAMELALSTPGIDGVVLDPWSHSATLDGALLNGLLHAGHTPEEPGDAEADAGKEAARKGCWEQAVECFEKAAELGSAMGLSRLADCIYKGRGTRPGRTQARRMWKEAAESGEVLSMIALGDDCAVRGETGRALIWYRKAREAAARMPDIEYTPQVCLRMAQTETRYTSRKKALALAAEAKQGFALLAREQEPDAAQWLAEAEQLIRELTAEPPAQPAAYDMDSLQLD